MSTATLPTAATHQVPAGLVTIDGIPTEVTSWTTRHGVDQPIGTVALTIPATSDTGHIDLNTTLEVQAGYAETGTRRVFAGRIAETETAFGSDGTLIRVQCEDWGTLLAFRLEADHTFRGAIRLDDAFRSFATVRGVPLFSADVATFPDGVTPITFGGIREIDGGNVVLRQRTVPLSWLTSKAKLFGYRVFGVPSGPTRLKRISGLPNGAPVATFTEGVDVFGVDHERSTRPMVTNWTVYGARYTDADGVPIEIRSIPGVVPPEPYLTPPGYRSDDVSDTILATQALVDAVRNVHEIDYSEASEIATWRTWGRPEIEPGDVVSIVSPSTGIATPRNVWVMSVSHTWSTRGFVTTFSGWRGAGAMLPAGIDETIISIGSGVYRLGDEYLWHYVIPNGGGREQVTIPFTVPGTYTSLALRLKTHGANSYLLSGVTTESTVSKLEVWQGGERVGTGEFPMSPEHLDRRYNYNNLAYWTSARIPIPGRLTAGAAELRIISGRDSRASSQYALDDFEVRDIQLEARGTGAAILPEVG